MAADSTTAVGRDSLAMFPDSAQTDLGKALKKPARIAFYPGSVSTFTLTPAAAPAPSYRAASTVSVDFGCGFAPLSLRAVAHIN